MPPPLQPQGGKVAVVADRDPGPSNLKAMKVEKKAAKQEASEKKAKEKEEKQQAKKQAKQAKQEAKEKKDAEKRAAARGGGGKSKKKARTFDEDEVAELVRKRLEMKMMFDARGRNAEKLDLWGVICVAMRSMNTRHASCSHRAHRIASHRIASHRHTRMQLPGQFFAFLFSSLVLGPAGSAPKHN